MLFGQKKNLADGKTVVRLKRWIVTNMVLGEVCVGDIFLYFAFVFGSGCLHLCWMCATYAYEKLVTELCPVCFLHEPWITSQKSEMGKNVCTMFQFSISRESFLSSVWANDTAGTHLCAGLLLLLELSEWRVSRVVSDNLVHCDSALCELLSRLLSARTPSVDLFPETTLFHTHRSLIFSGVKSIHYSVFHACLLLRIEL